MSGHKVLSVSQKCECCGANINLHGAFITRWTGHKNIFFHTNCYEAMVDGDATGSMGEQILAPLIHPVSNDAE
jgi:hypothetical protein